MRIEFTVHISKKWTFSVGLAPHDTPRYAYWRDGVLDFLEDGYAVLWDDPGLIGVEELRKFLTECTKRHI